MRSWCIILVFLTSACLAEQVAPESEAKPLVIEVPDPQELFRIEDLSPQQELLCAEFRRLAGECRKPAFDALSQAGAFPIDSKRIREDQVMKLLGEPSKRSDDWMSYSLGFCDGAGHSLDILVVNGRAVMITFGKTL